MVRRLSEYIKELQKIEAKEGGDLEVWYSVDDEGNEYCQIQYSPEVRLARKDDEGCVQYLYESEKEYVDELEEDLSNSKKVVLL
jgi:hypothetical protein